VVAAVQGLAALARLVVRQQAAQPVPALMDRIPQEVLSAEVVCPPLNLYYGDSPQQPV